jgi:nickel-dependent lactate racemase
MRLNYGGEKIELTYDNSQFDVLTRPHDFALLSDAEINQAFDAPIDSDALENLIDTGERVLIVVPDATRRAATGQVVNLLVRRLIAAGIAAFDINIIFATGIHRSPTTEEKREIVSPFIFQRIKTLDHKARDLMQIAGENSHLFADFGTTRRGTPIKLNRAVVEHDKIIIVGGIEFHYFAGFGGGRKLICPGLAAAETINETHKIVFDFERKKRREGVEIGRLQGNPVHEEFVEICRKVNPTFAVNTIVDHSGSATHVFAGNWLAAHERACEFYFQNHTLQINEKRSIVIVSAGGEPFDANLIQAHKALETAARACADGGTIVCLAKCREGFGRNDFLNWFATETAADLATRLEEKFQVNGQTAWSLLDKAERFKIYLISDLPANAVRQMRMHSAQTIAEALTQTDSQKGYVLPHGAKYLPIISEK